MCTECSFQVHYSELINKKLGWGGRTKPQKNPSWLTHFELCFTLLQATLETYGAYTKVQLRLEFQSIAM